MARLYPPITEEILPAFCLTLDSDGNKKGASINVNFNLNKATAAAEVSGMAMRLRTISTNTYVITENPNPNLPNDRSEGIALYYDLVAGNCTFQITEKSSDALELLKVGQYYKIQLAFLDLNGAPGYWSTIATIKCVAKPKAIIVNYKNNDTNRFNNEILGEYIQDTSTGDSSEKAYSYRFQLFDNLGNVIEDTGTKLHNSSSDISSFSSTDLFRCYRQLNENTVYYLQYTVTTLNGLTVQSPQYQVINIDSLPPEEDLTLSTTIYDDTKDWHPWEEGLVKIEPGLNGEDKAISGNYVILRASSRNNFNTWEEIKRFRLNGEKPSAQTMYDYTVEQGVTYRYALQQYNNQGLYSSKIYSDNDIVADFEDLFLYDGKRQLKVRFNPKVNSFKNDLQEQKIDTIGSKHPFIFRNGNICYKEFPVAGLISFQMDNAELFMNEEDYSQMNLERFEGITEPRSIEAERTAYSKTNLVSDNIMSERYFKLLVLDWLTDGKPKLFRSPTEGNYIVRLLNVSLTPKNELGRMIHEFTCTAYEVADFTYENLLALGFINVDTTLSNEYQWVSSNIKDILEKEPNEDGFYPISLNEKTLAGFSCIGFAPGDQIKLIFKDDPVPLIITIGTTGNYIYDDSKEIIGLSINPNNDTGDFPRTINLMTKGYTYQKFDTIASLNTYTRMVEQIVGPKDNIFKDTLVGKDGDNYAESANVYLAEQNNEYIAPKITLFDLLHLHAKRREVIPIFMTASSAINENSTFMLTPFGNGYIRSKSIYPYEIDWGRYGTLTTEERTRAFTVKDLVEFTIDKCNLDKFCLFEVYWPDTENGEWKKYIEYSDTTKSGIYDPYIENWWERPTEEDTPYYCPEIILDYGNAQTTIISLQDKIEETYENIDAPKSLSVGNGAIIELIYRIQYVDYTIENENDRLKAAKQQYLNTKAIALANINLYNQQVLAKMQGELLVQEYEEILRKLEDKSAYKQAIQNLVVQAQNKLKNEVTRYLTAEKQSVDNAMTQLQFLDLDLQDLGDIYTNSDFVVYGPNSLLTEPYNNYTTQHRQIVDSQIPDYTTFNDINDAETQVYEPYLERLNNGEPVEDDMLEALATIITNLNEMKQNITNELNQLGPNRFKSQYLDILQTEGQQLFFNKFNDTDYVYQLLYRNNQNPLDAQNQSILNSIWGIVFGYETDTTNLKEYPELQLTHGIQYTISNRPSSDECSNDSLIMQAINQKEFETDTQSLIDKLLTQINNSQTQESINEAIAAYELEYGNYYPNRPIALNNDSDNFKLHNIEIENNNIIVTISVLQQLIKDARLALSENPSQEDILTNIEQSAYGITMPERVWNPLKEYIKQYIPVTANNTIDWTNYDSFELALESYNFYISHQDDLTPTLKSLLQQQIKGQQINDSSYFNPTGNYFEDFATEFAGWKTAYDSIPKTIPGDPTEEIEQLNSILEEINALIRIRNDAAKQFNKLKSRFKSIDEKYNANENIKVILEEEKSLYLYAYNELISIQNTLINALVTNQNRAKEVYDDPYFAALVIYFDTKDIDNIDESVEAYKQLLEDAKAMRQTVVNEDYAPEIQQALITEAWKNYLDNLADVYNNEVKERFN